MWLLITRISSLVYFINQITIKSPTNYYIHSPFFWNTKSIFLFIPLATSQHCGKFQKRKKKFHSTVLNPFLSDSRSCIYNQAFLNSLSYVTITHNLPKYNKKKWKSNTIPRLFNCLIAFSICLESVYREAIEGKQRWKKSSGIENHYDYFVVKSISVIHVLFIAWCFWHQIVPLIQFIG